MLELSRGGVLDATMDRSCSNKYLDFERKVISPKVKNCAQWDLGCPSYQYCITINSDKIQLTS